jgi:predicted phage tail protein
MKIQAENARAYIQHTEALEKLQPNAPGFRTYEQLRRIEARASRTAEQLCNGELDQDEYEAAQDKNAHAVARVLGTLPAGFCIQGDPRGLALRCDLAPGLYRTWGGDCALAPQF